MKITILSPRSEFTSAQTRSLAKLGKVVYTDSRRPYPMPELIKVCANSDVLGFDPDNIGGFEVSHDRLIELVNTLPKLKGIALSTTAYGYIDLEHFRSRGIHVTNVPYYSSESVAEHAIALLLGCAKRIFLSDRRTQQGKYRLEMGYEIAGKTLGVIGLGNIGTRTGMLAQGLGLKVIAWNRTPKKVAGVTLQSLDKVLSHSDLLSLNLAENSETQGILSKTKIAKLKKGVIVVNTADRSLVDEKAMANALRNGHVDSYALEAEDLTSEPLGKIENAFLFKGFGWYTQEALTRNKEIWVKNICGLAMGKPLIFLW